jgi:hypothetical protein
MPVVFTVFELKSGWIQKISPIYFEEVPSKGEFIRFASVEAEEARWYEVLDMEFATDATSAGDIMLTLKRKLPQIEDTRVPTGITGAFRRLLRRGSMWGWSGIRHGLGRRLLQRSNPTTTDARNRVNLKCHQPANHNPSTQRRRFYPR